MAYFYVRPQSNYYDNVGAAVYAKRAWTDDWTWLPFMDVRRCSDVLAPSIPEAELVADFGFIKRAERSDFEAWAPYTVNGAYIQIGAFDHWSQPKIWYGVADLEEVFPDGNIEFPSGQQTFIAFGLEHLLDRIIIHGGFTNDGYIDRPMVFNEGRKHGLSYSGNRQTGSLYFGVGGEFSNLDIVNHLLTYWVNTGPITYELAGEYAVLDSVIETHDFEGMSVLDALHALIRRHRGASFKLLTTGSGTVYIHVVSLHSEPLYVEDVAIPANTEQTDVSFSGLRNVEPTITFDGLHLFDRFIVKGGPIFSCFSLSYADGTLEKDWTSTQETNYKAGTGTSSDPATKHDLERKREAYAAVYQRFQVPASWDGEAGDGIGGTQYNALPSTFPASAVDIATTANLHMEGKTFERELPLALARAASGVPEYRRPFAVFYVDDPENPGTYIPAMGHQLNALGYQNISVEMGDTGLSIQLDAEVNHILGLNHFDTGSPAAEATEIDPISDWEDLIVTVNLETDKYLYLDTVNLGYPVGENPRIMMIAVPDAEAWYVVPGTVTGVSDGALVHSTGGLVRDDSKRLRVAAARAIAWYGIPRAILQYDVGQISLAHPAGTMIRSISGPEGVTNVNTVVTSREWRFNGQEQMTNVVTGFVELDLVSPLGLRGLPARRFERRLRQYTERQTKVPLRRA